jgi:hypothetical protein
VDKSPWLVEFFYTGMSRIADPNVGNAILGVAFSSRWRTLSSSSAPAYVERIRILLPLLFVVFGILIVAIVVFKP